MDSLRTAALTAFIALAVLPVPAGAILPGPSSNGRIIFTSGRSNGDAQARLYLRTVVGSQGSGTASPFSPLGGQSRNASWSPDRTRAVYANCDAATAKCDLYIWNFVERTIRPLVSVAQTVDDLSSEHPAWSPDGTRVAYAHQPTVGSADRDIMVKRVGTGIPPVALTSGPAFEDKPAWSPDSRTIYYAKRNTANDLDIVSEPEGGGAVTNVVAFNGTDEYQPSISPGGTQICYTSQPLNNPGMSEVIVRTLGSGIVLTTNISRNLNQGDINCTWSPDGRKIAYVRGIFGQGELVMANSDGSSPSPISLEQDPGADNFDGNPDWAPDGRPDCGDSAVTTRVNRPVTIPLVCTDTGPEYEQTPVRETVANEGGPQNGTVDDFNTQANPSTVRYTPNQGFTGTDLIKSIGFDSFGFGVDEGAISVIVLAPGGGGPAAAQVPRCGGRLATIFGTARTDTLAGTAGRDVIAGLAGNDRILGGRGNDVICGGRGRDRLGGEGGSDRLDGGTSADRLSGSRGRDRLLGRSGRDQLSGGASPDRLDGGSGGDRLNGGSARDRCQGGSGRDRARACERRLRIP